MSNESKKYDSYYPVTYDYVSELPTGWKLVPNIGIFQERIERGHPEEELLSVTIGRGVIRQSELEKKDSSTADKSKYLLVHPGDLVYSMRFRQGASGYSTYRGIVSPACTVLRPKKGIELNPRYFYYLFRTEFYKNYVERFSYGIADGQIPLRYTDFKRMYSVVPPLEVQDRIVSYLDSKCTEIEKFISKKLRIIELLKAQKKSLISNAMTSWRNVNLVDSGVPWIGRIPSHWRVMNLKYVIKGKLKYGANEEAKESNSQHPRYIRITDFGLDGKLREETFCSLPPRVAKPYLLEVGDILFARSGATVGKTFQFKGFRGLACYAGYLIKATPQQELIESDFLYLYTQSSMYEEWKSSIFDKATIENIGGDKYSILKVIVPPLDEQAEIIDCCSKETNKINEAIDVATKEIDLIIEYRASLITNVVLGSQEVTNL